jgi:hypothetical protein
MYRLVTGKILKTTGVPWVNARVTFRRTQKSYTNVAQYPGDTVTVTTNHLGELSTISQENLVVLGVYLWCNEEGDISTEYECFLPNDVVPFKFTISADTVPISLSELFATGITNTNPNYSTLTTYVDNMVEDAVEGLVAGANRTVISNSYTATSAISALRVVNLQSLHYADCRDISNLSAVMGLATIAIAPGESFHTVISGSILDSNWYWDIAKPVFLGVTGFLTQQIPGDAQFIKQVATVIGSNQIFVDFQESIKAL